MNDDLYLKTHFPNYLASRTEKQASAGAKLPKALSKHFAHLSHLSHLARPLLAKVLDTLSDEVQVVYAHDDKITLSLPTITAVNHARYLKNDCLTALHQDEAFGQFVKISWVVNPKNTRHGDDIATDTRSTKPLSENTVQTITHSAKIVIKNKKLQTSLIRLIQNAHTKTPD